MVPAPFHHAWCTCRDCRPPLIGQHNRRLTRLLILGPAVAALIALLFLTA